MIFALLTASTEEAIGGWVPPNLLAAALLAMFSVGLTVVGVAARALLKRLDKLESTVESATKEISRLAQFATREQVSEGMSSMGNRFDERVAKARDEIARLEVRIARLEERGTRRGVK